VIEDVRDDPVVLFLLEKSSLTPTQLDTIMASRVEGGLAKKTALRDKRRVSKGAFLRTLRQGQKNVEASVCTLMLLIYLGLVPEGKMNQLMRTQRLLSKVKGVDLDRENVARLLSGMEEFASEFSERRGRKVIL
jgi:hypothetical protein